MKKAMSIMLSAIIVVSTTMVGCGSKSTATEANKGNGKVTLKMIGWSKEDNMKNTLDAIKKAIPNTEIEYQFVENKQYDNILNTQLAAEEAADIIMVGANVKNLASAGYLEDLSNQPFIEKYYDSGITSTKYKGKVYGIPSTSWFEGIFYNKEIFEKNNLKVPQTFDEWMNIHETLKKAGVKPQTMGAKSWEPLMKQPVGLALNDFYAVDAGKGFDEAFDAGTKTLSGNFNESFKKWTEVVQKGYITKEMLGMDYDVAQDEFASGKAAMWESGPWATETIKKKNPNLKFGMFPFPGTKQGSGWLVGGPGSFYAVNSKSKNKDTALKVLNALSTPEAQKAMFQDSPGSSFLKGVNFDLGAEYSDCNQAFKDGHVYCPWNNWFGAQTIITEIGKGMQDYIAGTKTVDDVLKTADEKAKDLRKSKQ